MHQSPVETVDLLKKVQSVAYSREMLLNYTMIVGRLVAPFVPHLMVAAIAAIIVKSGIKETTKGGTTTSPKSVDVAKADNAEDGIGAVGLASIIEDPIDLETPAIIKEDPVGVQKLDGVARMLLKHMDVAAASGLWILCGQSKNPVIKNAAAVVSAALLGYSIMNTAVLVK